MKKKSLNISINNWLDGHYDKDTKDEILRLKNENIEELFDAFYKDLEFGTGGLRGIMGVGPNRINKYTIATATQGVSEFLKKKYPNQQCRVAIGYDSRNNSRYFADITVDVLSANGIYCFLFEELRPVPLLSFAVRELDCHAGIMITASHNPKEYNGYKIYGNDGSQLVYPEDHELMEEVRKITSIQNILWKRVEKNIQLIGTEIDNAYLKKILSLSFNPASIQENKDFKILYSPLHGTGITLLPKALALYGFKNVFIYEAQATIDGDFPSVNSPNPEEKETMDKVIQEGERLGVDLVLATDPDADRMGIAVRNQQGKLVPLNGNMTASLLTHYVLSEWMKHKKFKGNEFIAKTIVTTDMLNALAIDFNIEYEEVLTGFKYIAEKIRKHEGTKQFIIGGEESYGMLIGDFVRDKDAISASCLIAEMAAHAATEKETLFDLLLKLYVKLGFYKEKLISYTKKGKRGAVYINKMMLKYREFPPRRIAGSKVVTIHDYLLQRTTHCYLHKSEAITLPKSDVIQFITEDNAKITVRPSGTEPKIKIYIQIKGELPSIEAYDTVNALLEEKVQKISRSFQGD